MIEFAHQKAVAEKIARSLADPTNPACWQVVMPPGFADEQLFAEQILEQIHALSTVRPVACVHTDAISGRGGYARALAANWGIKIDSDGSDALQAVLGGLTQQEPGIQILTHFHKIVRSLDAQVLGELRAAEQGPACRLRTVTLTPLPYSEIKERWRHEGVAFSVSDYGDTHHTVIPLPQSPKELHKILAGLRMPEKLIDFALALTGGYPATLKALIDRWELEDRPPPRKDVCELLRQTVEQRLDRFTDWLDRKGETRYCARVCDLHHGLDSENARIHISLHPWHEFLLDADGLRATGVGSSAAVRLARAAQDASDDTPRRQLWARGRELYRMGRYEEVQRLLQAAPGLKLRTHLRLLGLNARVLALLCSSGEASPADADWKEIIRLLEEARSVGATTLDAELLEPIYLQILGPAREIHMALGAGTRPVDVLAGLRGDHQSLEAAAFLLTLCYTAGKRVTGPSAAMKLVFELPEQIFRCWAFAALNINYYSAPVGGEDTWTIADAEWRACGNNRPSLERGEPGKDFRSFAALAYFSLAEHRRLGLPLEQAPEPNFAALERSLSYFDKRKDFAHAVAKANDKERQNYFDLIERWLDAFCSVCPNGISRTELAARLETLPLVAEDGALT